MARLVELKTATASRFAKRSGRGSPRHRHALGRADEPEPLSRGGDPVPADAPRALAHVGAIGKTLVSSSMIDRVVAKPRPQALRDTGGLQVVRAGVVRRHVLLSAARRAPGASFLRRDAHRLDDDKDGLIMNLLAAEITARTGRDPGSTTATSLPSSALRCTHASMPPPRRSRRRSSASCRRSR